MELKDVITLSISILAFLLSLAATIYTVIRTSYDEQLTFRNQLSDIMNKMVSLKVEEAREQLSNSNSYYSTTIGLFQEQYMTLLSQAMYQVEQGKNWVTPIDYNILAIANVNFRPPLAQKYALKAIEVCKDDYNRALATRS